MKNYLKIIIFSTIIIFNLSVFAQSMDYAIFIDAGSSGSRLHIFQYTTSSSFPVIKEIFVEKASPGISTYSDNPIAVEASLEKLLNHAIEFLKFNHISPNNVPISIFATAAMRFLEEGKQQEIYAIIEDYLKNNYAFSSYTIKTISGKMEGLYGWLDINYLLDNFQNNQPTVGSIDVGGASTQIVFAVNGHEKPDDEINLIINNRYFTVFSKSFLGLGQDRARATMLQDPAASTCFPDGFYFYNRGVTRFNIESCASIYRTIIENNKISEQLVSTNEEHFVGHSGIYFSYKFFNVDKTSHQRTLQSSIQNTCSAGWEELTKIYPDIMEKFLSTYCANGIYLDQLIHAGYGINGSQLTVTDKINDQEIDWTLGAALYSIIAPENL